MHIKDGLTQNESLATGDGMAVVAIFFYKGLDGRPIGQLEEAFQKSFDFGQQYPFDY